MKIMKSISIIIACFIISGRISGAEANMYNAGGPGLKQIFVKQKAGDEYSCAYGNLQNIVLAKLDKKALPDKKKLNPLERLAAEQNAAQKKEQAAIDDLKKKLEELNALAAKEDNSLDVMISIIEQRKELEKKLAKLEKKQKKEEVKRQAKIKRLKEQIKKKDIGKYKKIISSPFGEGMKDFALKALLLKYPDMKNEIETGESKEPQSGTSSDDKSGSGENATGPAKITTNTIGMEFALILPGTFKMGSPVDEQGRDDDEAEHQVTLTKSFYIQTTEVTQGQWKKVMGNNPSSFKVCGDDCPVENISWIDCKEFVRVLNSMEKTSKYRLVTEAEWEYACRAGTVTAFAGGKIQGKGYGKEPDLDKMGWHSGNSLKKTNPVGQKMPNSFGLFDMHGNIWEWCQDWYGKYNGENETDPKGPSSGLRRIIRGGGWLHRADHCRSANRFSGNPGFKARYVGFRMAWTPL